MIPFPRRLKPLSVTWSAAIVLVAALALPAVVYVNRFLIPDYSFDTLNYHLFNGWRGWSTAGQSFSPAEFYPAGNGSLPPFLDALFVPARLVLGYRLGTSPGLLAYWLGFFATIGIGRRLFPALRQRLTAFHALIIFYASANLEMLFQLATYFVDILNLAFLLSGFLCILHFQASVIAVRPRHRWLVAGAACYGLAFCGKLTDIAFVVPAMLSMSCILLVSARGQASRQVRLMWFGLGTALMLGPVAIGCIGNLAATGNPVFPLANRFFHSPYMAAVNLDDPTVGGTSLLGRLTFPVTSVFNPTRLAEPNGLYTDYQVTITWIGALLLVALHAARRHLPSPPVTMTLFNYLAGLLLWSLAFGVERYAAYGLVLGGVLLIGLAQESRDMLRSASVSRGTAIIIAAAVLGQIGRVAAFNLRYDMSFRPTLVHDPGLYLHQRYELFDNALRLPMADGQVNRTDIVLNCSVAGAGYATISPLRDKPMIDIVEHPNSTPLVTNAQYHAEVVTRLHIALGPDTQPGPRALQFAAFATLRGLDPSEGQCLRALKNDGAQVHSIRTLPDFLGYDGQTVDLIVGVVSL